MKNIPLIANSELRKSDLPASYDGWQEIAKFAQTFDGYSHCSDLSVFADRVLEEFKRDKKLPESLSDLRACLCYEQKRWRRSEPDYEAMGYLKALMDAIRPHVHW